jgi:hypothetical protein
MNCLKDSGVYFWYNNHTNDQYSKKWLL